jgi:hypothetical protein
MDNQKRRVWLRAVLLTGAIYCAIGIGFAFAAWSSSRGWCRLEVASFIISLVVFAVHIGYDYFGMAIVR